MPSQPPLFRSPTPVIGMIHVGALPGTPAHSQNLAAIERQAVAEALLYRDAGVDGLMLENMHDTPYLRGSVGHEITASLSVVARAVREASGLTCGIQVLAAANREALAVALAAGLSFIRAEGFAFAHVADEGIIQSCAAELLRYRKQIGADSIQIWADVKKKHSSHAITADVGIGETAHAVEFMRGDAIIVTGMVTGDAPKPDEVREVKRSTALPVYLGSGVTAANVATYLGQADGFIIGSEFKEGGHWSGKVAPRRIETFMTQMAASNGQK